MTKIIEDGIEAGTWNKYQSRNPIQRRLVRDFLETLSEIARPCAVDSHTAIDLGCGEGVTTSLLRDAGLANIVGMDFSSQILDVAKTDHPDIPFETVSIYDLNENHRADFVSACEVLEHLEQPARGLERMAAVCQKHCLLSVPNEPIFRTMNFCAGKYLSRFGNSPGHLNHWSSRNFVKFVSTQFEVVKVSRPLPWIIVLARPKR